MSRQVTLADKGRRRMRLVFRGVVQGVGFRPALYRLAVRAGLDGFAKNTPKGVVVEVEGSRQALDLFLRSLDGGLPSNSRVESFSRTAIPTKGKRTGFSILASLEGRREFALTPPDSVLCDRCRSEMEEEGNRRFRYPFINCTYCGPRFTIIRSFPYDRERTSMGCFRMCEECSAEYGDPSDRRYHAEATCCPSCGPEIRFCDRRGRTLAKGGEAVESAKRLLESGGILALKGLGGFQLAVDASDGDAVRELRKRKNRKRKPFAVMVDGMRTAREICRLNRADADLLRSCRGPIVIVPGKGALPVEVAPGIDDVGVFLPTTPLHVELFREAAFRSLVMTSGNLSDEPIAVSNREALERLGAIADRFLFHDRDILRRQDDSVARGGGEAPFVVRRSRGYTVEPLETGFRSGGEVLALGGFLQNAACMIKKDKAFFTPHVGDLDTPASREFLHESVSSLEKMLEISPSAVAVDMHPDYPSRWMGEALAKKRRIRLVEVQHHVAHLASVLAENGTLPLKAGEKRFGIVLDGTGLGTDGTLWGGEFLALDGRLRWKRLSSLEPFVLPGGERSVREPVRVARSLLAGAPGSGGPLSSGAGRLFEAAGALCGLAEANSYEGESAILFEALAERWKGKADMWQDCKLGDGGFFPSAAFFRVFARRLQEGRSRERTAMEFHVNFARLVCEAATVVFPAGATVGLSGGCFNNRILRKEIFRGLAGRGFKALLHRAVPSGDGGLALGQAVLAARSVTTGRDIEES